MLDMGLPSVCTQAHQCVCVHYVCSLKEHYRGMHLKGHTHIHVVHIKCTLRVRQDITRQRYRVDTPKHQIPRSDIGYPGSDVGDQYYISCSRVHSMCACVHYVCSLKEHYRGMHLKGHTHIHVVHIKCTLRVRQDITRQRYRVDTPKHQIPRSDIGYPGSDVGDQIVYLLTRIVCLVDYTCVVHVHVEGIPLVCTVHPLMV